MPDNEHVTIGATDGHKINLFLNSRGAVVEETFRLDLNQSWEAIDIKTGSLTTNTRTVALTTALGIFHNNESA